MPNIQTYDATGSITPSDKGIEAAELAGRRISGLYHQIGAGIKEATDAVAQHMAVMETSELYKTGAELKINLQQRYDAESADPKNRNDPHFGDRFMGEAGPLIDEWAKGASTDHGKLLAAEMGASIRTEVFNHVHAGQAEMDSAHVIDNGRQTISSLGQGLITDPSEPNLDRTIGTAKDAIQGMTMAIPDVATRERVATELQNQYLPQLVLSRYQGVAESIKNQIGQTGGETSPALEQLDKDIASQLGYQYLSPEQQARIPEIRDSAVREGKELFNSRDATQRRQDKEDFDAAILPIETGMFRDNGAGGVTMAVTPDLLAQVQRAAAMPGAKQDPGRIEALLNAMHTATQDQISGKEQTTDHSTYVHLTSMIGSNTNPLTTTEVDKAYAAHQLSDPDYHFLRTSAVDSKQQAPKAVHAYAELNHWLEQVKPMIDKSNPIMGSIDQSGATQFSYFSWDAQHKLRQAIASGEDPEAAVQRLTDPRGKLNFYQFIPQYQTSTKSSLRNVLQATQTQGSAPIPAPPGAVGHVAVPPAKPGESPDAYLKRIQQ